MENKQLPSPLWWVGGKSFCVDKILSMIPKHRSYVEVFFGGGSIFFAKPPSKVEVVNDANGELINYYRIVKTNVEEFKKRGDRDLYSRQIYAEYVDDIKSTKHFEYDDVERAWRFYYIARNSRNGIFGSALSIHTHMNKIPTFWDLVEHMDDYTKRMHNCMIENLDFQEVIEKYDRDFTFHLCDPPYIKPGANIDNYYYNLFRMQGNKFEKMKGRGFGLNEHQRLYNALKNVEGKFLLTIDDCQWIRDRYDNKPGEFWITDNTFYYGSKDQHVNELIITNYDPKTILKGSAFQKTVFDI